MSLSRILDSLGTTIFGGTSYNTNEDHSHITTQPVYHINPRNSDEPDDTGDPRWDYQLEDILTALHQMSPKGDGRIEAVDTQNHDNRQGWTIRCDDQTVTAAAGDLATLAAETGFDRVTVDYATDLSQFANWVMGDRIRGPWWVYAKDGRPLTDPSAEVG